jgi:hypothetical protein
MLLAIYEVDFCGTAGFLGLVTLLIVLLTREDIWTSVSFLRLPGPSLTSFSMLSLALELLLLSYVPMFVCSFAHSH